MPGGVGHLHSDTFKSTSETRDRGVCARARVCVCVQPPASKHCHKARTRTTQLDAICSLSIKVPHLIVICHSRGGVTACVMMETSGGRRLIGSAQDQASIMGEGVLGGLPANLTPILLALTCRSTAASPACCHHSPLTGASILSSWGIC